MQITPNRRLAIFLHKAQKKVNKTPVLPLQTWIEMLWEQLKSCTEVDLKQCKLLTSYEEELIWEKIISNSDSGKSLVRVRPIATLAREANELIQQWNISSFNQFSDSEEGLAFFDWWSTYKQELHHQKWLDRSSLLDLITEHLPILSQVENAIPLKIECVGFTEWTPQQTRFFASLRNQGTELLMTNISLTPQSVVQGAFPNEEIELQQAILTAGHWLEQNPKAQIGLVVLDLEQRREEIEELLQRFLPSDCFNVSAPIPLLQHPIIAAALLGLSLTRSRIPLETISRFLRSSFFQGGIEEQAWRAALDVALHELKQSHYSVEEIIAIAKTSFAEGTTSLLISLQHFIELKASLGNKKNTSEWIEMIKQILVSLGWGLGRALNENEARVQEEWASLLDSYQALEKILGMHSFREARHHLEMLAQRTAFTPPTKNANIHALGLLEAVGMPFDYLWCLGFSEKVWPKPPAANPFIPLPLQYSLNLPRSTAARELQKAKDFTSALSQGAKQNVIFSYPTTVEDRQLRISPLLKHLPEQPLYLQRDLSNTLDAEVSQNQSIHPRGHSAALGGGEEIKIPPTQQLKGSVRALTLQAQCPFKAFAELRLKAASIQPPPSSLTKSERGEMIHEVLHLFWRDTKTQRHLMALSEETLDGRLKNNINAVVLRWEKRFPKRLTPRYMLLERERILDLLLRFIRLEKSRASFEVQALELKTECHLGPLEFRLRIDRIDKLSNGEELLIDYKTGQTQMNHWLGAQLQEPQLPLYCITRNPMPVGIAFGVLRSNDVKYQGIAREDLSITGVKHIATPTTRKASAIGEDSASKEMAESWEALSHAWRKDLTKLAVDFAEGVATVNPREGDKTCRMCNLQSLCRIYNKETPDG